MFPFTTIILTLWPAMSLQWCHNERDGISNHQPHDCSLNRLFRRRSKKTSKLCVTSLCKGNSPVTGEFSSCFSHCWRANSSTQICRVWCRSAHYLLVKFSTQNYYIWAFLSWWCNKRLLFVSWKILFESSIKKQKFCLKWVCNQSLHCTINGCKCQFLL